MVNLPIEYSEKPVTPFGGMALMKRFVDQTGIREHLATLDLRWTPKIGPGVKVCDYGGCGLGRDTLNPNRQHEKQTQKT